MSSTIDKTIIPVSPMPIIDTDLVPQDYTDIVKSRDHYYREQFVRLQEMNIVRDKLKWCFKREGVNHFQNCRHLSQQYIGLLKEMKDGWIKPYVQPLPKE